MSCYDTDGKVTTKFIPCNTTAVLEGHHTQCCKEKEFCMTNGLCKDFAQTDKSNYFFIEGCTDKTWNDAACSIRQECQKRNADLFVWKCPDKNSYCCNNGGVVDHKFRSQRTNVTCCDKEEFLFQAEELIKFTTAAPISWPVSTLLPDLTIRTSETTATLSDISTTSTTSGTETLPSSAETGTTPEQDNTMTGGSNSVTSNDKGNSGLGVGGAVGLGVGLGAAVIIAAAAIFLLVKRRKQKAQRIGSSELAPAPPRYEMDGRTAYANDKVSYEMRA